MSRPTKYRKEFTKLAFQLGLLGATDIQIADALNVAASSIYEWKNKHKGFSEALRRGKTIADAKVAAGLFRRAQGFKYDELTYERIELGEPLAEDSIKSPIYKRKVVTKYVPPDTGAATTWLKNRQRDLWRDNTADLNFEKLTEEQLDQIIERLKKGYEQKD
jgi:hypothetical protein